MAKKYLDFDLRIWRSPEGYCANASSADRSATGPVSLASTFRDGELEAVLAQSCVLPRDIETATGSQVPRQVRELGRRLFAAVFRDGIRALWAASRELARRSGKGLRLRLILQENELWSWPWELLADPDGDLLITAPDISIVRYPEVPERVAALKVKSPIRVLVAVSDPQGTPRLGYAEELESLRSLLRVRKRRRRWKLELLEHATLSGLEQVLEKSFHILHFIGHGALDRITGEGVLLFETKDGRPDLVLGSDLAAILKGRSRIALVVLNTCEGGRAPRDDPFAGVAQSLIRGGIPSVVAMQSKVADEASIVFSRVVYKNLAQGASLDEAVYKGRRALIAERFGFEWANPVLYMRASDGHILHIKKPWGKLTAAAIILLLLTIGFVFKNRIRAWLVPAPSPVASDPGCPSPPGLDMPFARIDPGTFSMGSDRGPEAERPAHNIRITRPYCIGRFEVTQRQWQQMMGENPSRHRGDFWPVEGVSWTDTQKFLNRLNQLDPAGRYRLPTEAEWEFAAVSGGGSVERGKTSRYGNCLGWWEDGFVKTARIGVFEPNKRGVFDLYGNVSEWVDDWFGPYRDIGMIDPAGPDKGEEKVRRGGFFGNSAGNCTATHRASAKPGRRAEDTGLRVVRDVRGELPER
jgi:formylglycine-generating enzyme required for sulfatase activity